MQNMSGRGISLLAGLAMMVLTGCGGPKPIVTATTTSVTTVIPTP
jgi:hypothetical protein